MRCRSAFHPIRRRESIQDRSLAGLPTVREKAGRMRGPASSRLWKTSVALLPGASAYSPPGDGPAEAECSQPKEVRNQFAHLKVAHNFLRIGSSGRECGGGFIPQLMT